MLVGTGVTLIKERAWEEVLLLSEPPRYMLCVQDHILGEKIISDESHIIDILKRKGYIEYINTHKDFLSGRSVYWYKLTPAGKAKQIELKK